MNGYHDNRTNGGFGGRGPPRNDRGGRGAYRGNGGGGSFNQPMQNAGVGNGCALTRFSCSAVVGLKPFPVLRALTQITIIRKLCSVMVGKFIIYISANLAHFINDCRCSRESCFGEWWHVISWVL